MGRFVRDQGFKRLTIDVTVEEHKRLKVEAATLGITMQRMIVERALQPRTFDPPAPYVVDGSATQNSSP